jgi:hypothetical protein
MLDQIYYDDSGRDQHHSQICKLRRIAVSKAAFASWLASLTGLRPARSGNESRRRDLNRSPRSTRSRTPCCIATNSDHVTGLYNRLVVADRPLDR